MNNQRTILPNCILGNQWVYWACLHSMGDPKAALLKSPHPAWMKVSPEPQTWSPPLLSPRLNTLPPPKTLRLCAIQAELCTDGYKEHMDSPMRVQWLSPNSSISEEHPQSAGPTEMAACKQGRHGWSDERWQQFCLRRTPFSSSLGKEADKGDTLINKRAPLQLLDLQGPPLHGK